MLGDIAHNNGLGQSLLHRLDKAYKSFGSASQGCSIMLRGNYRCEPNFLEMSSILFYQSRLVSFGNVKCHPQEPYPLKFICSRVNEATLSPASDFEVQLIIDEVDKLLACKDTLPEQVCILTTNQKQVCNVYNYIELL